MQRPRKAYRWRFPRKHGPRPRPRAGRPCCSTVRHLPRFASADRKSLLLGTALASTLLAVGVLAPSPAHAQAVDCLAVSNPPAGASGPITVGVPVALNQAVRCVNGNDRQNNDGNVIDLRTQGNDHYIYLNNSGTLTAADTATDALAIGILTITDGTNGQIDIVNSGHLGVTATGTDSAYAYGIDALTQDSSSPLDILNAGDIVATATAENAYTYGIRARTQGTGSFIDVVNRSAIEATAIGTGGSARVQGMHVRSARDEAPVTIVNSGDVTATATGDFFVGAYGILARTMNEYSPIDIFPAGISKRPLPLPAFSATPMASLRSSTIQTVPSKSRTTARLLSRRMTFALSVSSLRPPASSLRTIPSISSTAAPFA